MPPNAALDQALTRLIAHPQSSHLPREGSTLAAAEQVPGGSHFLNLRVAAKLS